MSVMLAGSSASQPIPKYWKSAVAKVATGIDIDSGRIQQAVQFFQLAGQTGRFLCHDFLTCPLPNSPKDCFDLILVHDVIEHIAPQAKLPFLQHIHGFLRCGGIVFIGFPAWHNPFGGHQQISAGLASKLPFIHLLPNPLYQWMLQSRPSSKSSDAR